jgi:hypothetical protein
MSEFLHIDLPSFTDADILELEKVLGIKFVPVYPQMIPLEKIKVCPMSEPSGQILWF